MPMSYHCSHFIVIIPITHVTFNIVEVAHFIQLLEKISERQPRCGSKLWDLQNIQNSSHNRLNLLFYMYFLLFFFSLSKQIQRCCLYFKCVLSFKHFKALVCHSWLVRPTKHSCYIQLALTLYQRRLYIQFSLNGLEKFKL